MKTKYIIAAALAMLVMPATAQETYENAKLANSDLNGTARYVGMGGAMDALGADLSTISSNPAGIGLFRRPTANISFGLVSQQDGKDFANGNKTNASFDQVGFVYAMKSGRNSFLNFGFNYHKSKNFDYILSAAHDLKDASQNKLTYIKGDAGYLFDDKGQDYITSTRLDELLAHKLMDLGDDQSADYRYENSTGYMFDRAHTGYIGRYDFNVSGNLNDRVYLGLTMGMSDVHYKGYSEYIETLEPNNGFNRTEVNVADDRRITGTGFDITAGVIVRPIEESPFRIGLSVKTPTWYDLSTSNQVSLGSDYVRSDYDFKVYTPWKFGLSLGHTIGNVLALGAVYEYEDFGSIDSRINTGASYDYWYDDYYNTSESDNDMNDHAEETLKGVSTLKLGLEYKPIPALALRAGYNYQSAIYSENGVKGVLANGNLVQSPGIYYSSTTDYTNWKGTNRFTLGIGYAVKNFNVDLAYQYSTTDGEFYPFMSYTDDQAPDMNNIADAVSVSNKRHQVLLTLGYRF